MIEKNNIKKVVEQISDKLRHDGFQNEAAVSDGVLKRLLHELGWPVFNTDVVMPEYKTSQSGRVDFALCNRPREPFIFVEVKAPGKISAASEKQLLGYAVADGAPMLILTDGCEWNFYLTAEQGTFSERQFYKLSLLERSLDDGVNIFCDFLSYEKVISGEARDKAKKFLESARTQRTIKATMPKAWERLLSEPDEMLRDLLAEATQKLCGYKPDIAVAEDFLKSKNPHENNILHEQKRDISDTKKPFSEDADSPNKLSYKFKGIMYDGKFIPVKHNFDALKAVIPIFSGENNNFVEKLSHAHDNYGIKNPIISKDKYNLYPEKERCDDSAREIELAGEKWWLGCILSTSGIIRRMKICCEISGKELDKDLKIIYREKD